MATVKIIAATSPISLCILKDDGEYYTRTPYAPDKKLDGVIDNPKMMRAALLTKWEMYRVLDEDGSDEPDVDENEIPILDPVLEGSERVFRITERVPPDWDNPLPWQKRP